MLDKKTHLMVGFFWARRIGQDGLCPPLAAQSSGHGHVSANAPSVAFSAPEPAAVPDPHGTWPYPACYVMQDFQELQDSQELKK